jgi:hypothetical protein
MTTTLGPGVFLSALSAWRSGSITVTARSKRVPPSWREFGKFLTVL